MARRHPRLLGAGLLLVVLLCMVGAWGMFGVMRWDSSDAASADRASPTAESPAMAGPDETAATDPDSADEAPADEADQPRLEREEPALD